LLLSLLLPSLPPSSSSPSDGGGGGEERRLTGAMFANLVTEYARAVNDEACGVPVISTAWDSVTAAECAAASEAAVGRHAAFLGAALEPLPKKETAAQMAHSREVRLELAKFSARAEGPGAAAAALGAERAMDKAFEEWRARNQAASSELCRALLDRLWRASPLSDVEAEGLDAPMLRNARKAATRREKSQNNEEPKEGRDGGEGPKEEGADEEEEAEEEARADEEEGAEGGHGGSGGARAAEAEAYFSDDLLDLGGVAPALQLAWDDLVQEYVWAHEHKAQKEAIKVQAKGEERGGASGPGSSFGLEGGGLDAGLNVVAGQSKGPAVWRELASFAAIKWGGIAGRLLRDYEAKRDEDHARNMAAVEAFRVEAAAAAAQGEALASSVGLADGEAAALRAATAVLEARAAEASERADALEGQFGAHQIELSALEHKLSESSVELGALQSELAQAREDLELCQAEKSKSDKDRQYLQDRIDALPPYEEKKASCCSLQ